MKIVLTNKVYIQKKDIINYTIVNKKVPNFIIDRYLYFSDNIMELSNMNNCSFTEYTSNEAIEYIKNTNWLIDYIEYKDIEIFELYRKLYKVKTLKNELTSSNCKNTYKEWCMDDKINYSKLNVVYNDIAGIIEFKTGEGYLELPQDVKYPEDFKLIDKISNKVKCLINR